MNDFETIDQQPWSKFRETMVKMFIEEGTTSIGANAFASHVKLASLRIPTSATHIGNNAFYQCEKIGSMTIETNIESIGESAFENCLEMTTLEFAEDSECSIGAKSFKGCQNLKSVNFGKKITEIGESSFENTGIENLVLPGTIEKIGVSGFKSCSSMQTVGIEEG